MEKLSLLLTEGPSLVHCEYSTKKIKNKKKKSSIECQYSMKINTCKENNDILAFLSVRSESQDIPFSFDVSAKAVFSIKGIVVKEEPKEKIEAKLVPITIPYIFIFLKEMVADLTRKSGLNPFYLPSIELNTDFFDKVKD